MYDDAKGSRDAKQGTYDHALILLWDRTDWFILQSYINRYELMIKKEPKVIELLQQFIGHLGENPPSKECVALYQQ